ncbi:hypothetical protein NMY22_g11181 [Coprinellus aureogranulatus]|nr:hypothetical protein NMY22_g11181 [Coprinellus aureogranulatus]
MPLTCRTSPWPRPSRAQSYLRTRVLLESMWRSSWLGVDDEAVEKGADPEGVVFVRGPPVGKLVNVDGYVDVHSESTNEEERWTGIGLRAKVQSNGSFVVLTD